MTNTSPQVAKHLPAALALAETLAVTCALQGTNDNGPFSQNCNAYRVISAFAKRIAPKGYRKITSAAYDHYITFKAAA